MKHTDVIIYTDGACSGNPGPGGWAAILLCGKHERKISGACGFTTNNQMELTAIVHALRMLKYECNVIVRSDSAYIVNQVNNGYLDKWIRNGWRTSENRPVANLALWEEISNQRKKHDITFEKVKAHSGDKYNELADAEACRERDSMENVAYLECIS